MAGSADLMTLREALDFLPRHLSESATHAELAADCEALGMPTPPSEQEGTKFRRASASFAALPDSALVEVAQKVLATGSLPAEQRTSVEDALWALSAYVPIPARVRRELARALHLPDIVHHPDRFTQVLDDLWILDDNPLDVVFGDGGRNLRTLIDRHVYRNPGDWSTEELFERLGAFKAPDARFGVFLERLASGDLSCDERAQRAFVEAVNPHLRTVGVELRETGERDGDPVFGVVSVGSHRGRPKNLIFASIGKKPDLRFRDAVDNDVEIVGNADDVLVYDRTITGDGLRWRDLQAWWRETRGLDSDEDAKRALQQAHGLPAGQLTSAATSVRAVPPCPRRPGAGTSGLAAGGLAALGFPDREGAGQGCPVEVPHGLPAPAAPRAAGGAGGRREASLRNRRPSGSEHLRQDHASRPRAQAQRLRGLPVRRRRTRRRRAGRHRRRGVLPRSVPHDRPVDRLTTSTAEERTGRHAASVDRYGAAA
ncbi:hypothetical protein [Saccharothrix australiensis]|uniref:AbiJ-related protein n=1 Tax=Saccharothrix australiensis TaxID=2072 RepID=UPI001B86B0FD|nr:hypothetical protein [Saccharothrix australiensis]